MNCATPRYQLLWEQELGLPWETPETWEAISPFNNVGSAQTPTLIMCGEKDWNVPVIKSTAPHVCPDSLSRRRADPRPPLRPGAE